MNEEQEARKLCPRLLAPHDYCLNAASRFRKPCIPTCLLCRSSREKLIQIFGIAFLGAHCLAEFFHEDLDHRGNLELNKVFSEELDDLPVLAGQVPSHLPLP